MNNKEVDVLIATVEQDNFYSLLEKQNIKTSAIIANQTNKFSKENIFFKENSVQIFNFSERGVGLNRNNSLFRSDKEICIIADDDVIYYDNYAEVIKKAFEQNKEADVIIFNLDEVKNSRFIIKKKMNINWLNFTRFGAARIAVKRSSILKKRITFSVLFGGGASYSAGEDTLFLRDCLKSGLKIVGLPITIGRLDSNSVSSWFTGYNEKLLYDTGACFSELFKFQLYPRIFYFAFKNFKKYEISFFECYKLILKGKKDFEKK
ncbi:hypothetical protein EsVE80_05290 [Enterococcus saigonensis]|uniref:Glycosyltransferase 2-like domain-containing protein n=1 Tax=Enterococcus saigonensis TaxID=1805431 RepID=A0A679IIN8_9ENTE|nr:glycosyltransferase family A protein [Enterococcus saigonensis]BCA85006.1 hypothetical protein EsVE80_05290 [Enterococcus saigonensis]